MYLFNPEHDLALANFSPNYTPPAAVSLMAAELPLLPVWYSGGEPVVAEGEQQRLYLEAVQQLLPITSSLVSYSEVSLQTNQTIIPWGWDPVLRKRLLSYGVHEERLPSPEELQMLRDYSHRQHAVRILGELQAEEAAFCGESRYFTSLEDLLGGKGLIRVMGAITDKQIDWCRRVIRGQGGVVAEPVLRKVEDFAMEFYLKDGNTSFASYSLFRASTSGAYLGNELLSDALILEKLSRYIPIRLLEDLRVSLTAKLAASFPRYNGYAGVDMMICETEDGYRIQPCVEINMRMNMGMVARIFYNRFMAADGMGTFTVDYFKNPGDALAFHQKMQQESPLKVQQGRIISGYLALTPIIEATRFAAYVIV
ncbi:MAG: hypothetical protein PWQ38_1016 [Proteiniphilum sp.]|nr:hypothetical protein [Proteiniphilum sp.]